MYNNWSENFTIGIQRQIQVCRRITELEDKTVNYTVWGTKGKKTEGKWTV